MELQFKAIPSTQQISGQPGLHNNSPKQNEERRRKATSSEQEVHLVFTYHVPSLLGSMGVFHKFGFACVFVTRQGCRFRENTRVVAVSSSYIISEHMASHVTLMFWQLAQDSVYQVIFSLKVICTFLYDCLGMTLKKINLIKRCFFFLFQLLCIIPRTLYMLGIPSTAKHSPISKTSLLILVHICLHLVCLLKFGFYKLFCLPPLLY